MNKSSTIWVRAERFSTVSHRNVRNGAVWYSQAMLRITLKIVAFSLCFSAATPAAVAQDAIRLPDLGDESAAVISPAQERKLGENFIRKARGFLAFVDDPELTAYVQSLGDKLVAVSDNPEIDFRFFVIRDPAINAFAVPGGFIAVHTGLLLASESEAELSSVLAHEIAHVTQRHIPRMIADAQRTSLPTMAAVLASILLAASGHQGGEAAIALTSATIVQRGINFTRAFEEEADRIGMKVLVAADFDPRAMPAFFERMQALNRYNESNLPEFLRTHPVTSNRIADSRARAERYTYRVRPDSVEFHHARSKLRAMAPGDPGEIAGGFKNNLDQEKYRDADAERYGYAWALLRDRQFAAARDQALQLAARGPRRVAYDILRGEIEMAAENYSQAIKIFEAAYKIHPDYMPLIRFYIRALLKTNHSAAAKDLIKTGLRMQPDDAELYQLLAQAAGETGAPVEAHQAMAEYYYLNGDSKAAIEQLQIARRGAGDSFYLRASLEARIQAIKDELALYQQK
jgi:predicted Zn-dependent protease